MKSRRAKIRGRRRAAGRRKAGAAAVPAGAETLNAFGSVWLQAWRSRHRAAA